MHRAKALAAFLAFAYPAGQAAPPVTVTAHRTAPEAHAVRPVRSAPDPWREAIDTAARAAGVPPEILAGIAWAESSYRAAPQHRNPLDRGMFGLHESPEIRAERVARFGTYDPLDPAQAARIAAGILAEHRVRLGSWDEAIAAYHQGARGLRRDGMDRNYVNRVRSAP